MERNYDEVISDMLIQLDAIERRMAKADKRMDLTIKRDQSFGAFQEL
jgi:hypothetical protein